MIRDICPATSVANAAVATAKITRAFFPVTRKSGGSSGRKSIIAPKEISSGRPPLLAVLYGRRRKRKRRKRKRKRRNDL